MILYSSISEGDTVQFSVYISIHVILNVCPTSFFCTECLLFLRAIISAMKPSYSNLYFRTRIIHTQSKWLWPYFTQYQGAVHESRYYRFGSRVCSYVMSLLAHKIEPALINFGHFLLILCTPLAPCDFLADPLCKRDWWNSDATEDFSRLYAGKILALWWDKPYFPNFSSLMLRKSLLYAGKILV